MKSYENKELLTMPKPKPYEEMSDEELAKTLTNFRNYNILIPALIESNYRKDKQIADLNRRISLLEEKTLKKVGRKKKTFYLDGKELTDADIVYLIDYEFYDSIGKLEKAVGAGKNQLRNRYNKEKKKQKLEREMKKIGNC